jgi:regulator of cell morphogenesis and NO signaling
MDILSKNYLTSEIKMSDAIIKNPYLLLLLEHFGIALPLQDKSIDELCLDHNLNTKLFLTFANLYHSIQQEPNTPVSVDDTNSIVEYLKNCHKFYSEEIYPNILQTIQQMALINNYKEMALVHKFFIEYFNEVTEHLKYEEEVVFPYILDLYGVIKNKDQSGKHSSYSVMEYKDHHNDIQDKLNDLKNLLIKYLPEKNDQPLRRRLLLSLSELEYDLNIHSQIEDSILIPLVSKMESYLNQSR